MQLSQQQFEQEGHLVVRGLAPNGSDPRVAPWHQDAGVTWEGADPHFILTVWIPLSPTTPENGCLQI